MKCFFFLDKVKKRTDIGIVYFTFGADFEKISKIIDTYREVKNKYLVTKTVSTDNIIVAYKYGVSDDVVWVDPAKIGNDKWTPKIIQTIKETTVNSYPKYNGKEDYVLCTQADALVFTSIALYNEFVMKLLKEGDVLFRATYDPDNEHFQKRTNDTKCKFLYTNNNIDTYIYDDNIQDWHNDENLHKHCKFQRALIKPNFDKILEYEKLLQLRNILVKVKLGEDDKQIINHYSFLLESQNENSISNDLSVCCSEIKKLNNEFGKFDYTKKSDIHNLFTNNNKNFKNVLSFIDKIMKDKNPNYKITTFLEHL